MSTPSTLRRRLSTSMSMMSPSSRAARGPPTAASGATCPTIRPCVAPEKRPSVTIATESPRPSPTIAAVTCSISRMPGPPFGPSYRITTVSPGLIRPAETAANASSSRLKTRAGPRCEVGVCAVIFTTAPSGARFPRRTTRPPSARSGRESGATTSWPAVSVTDDDSSPIDRPVTVRASPSM